MIRNGKIIYEGKIASLKRFKDDVKDVQEGFECGIVLANHDNIKEGDKVIGTRHRVKIVKNKIAPPFRVAEFDIMAEEGISKEGGLLDVALELGLVTKSGAFFRWGAKMLGQGRESAKEYFREHKKEFAVLEKEIWAKVKKGLPTKPKVTNSESEDEEILEDIAAA